MLTLLRSHVSLFQLGRDVNDMTTGAHQLQEFAIESGEPASTLQADSILESVLKHLRYCSMIELVPVPHIQVIPIMDPSVAL